MNSCSGCHSFELMDCYHIPDTDGNLLSLHHFNQAGGEIRIKSGIVHLITSDGTKICQGMAQGESLYEMDMSADNVPAVMAGTMGGDVDGCTWEDWHRAMGQSYLSLISQTYVGFWHCRRNESYRFTT